MSPLAIIFLVCAVFALLVAIISISLAVRKKEKPISKAAGQHEDLEAAKAKPRLKFRPLLSKGVDLSNVEDQLIMADVGTEKSREIVENLKGKLSPDSSEDDIKRELYSYLTSVLSPMDRALDLPDHESCAVIVAGVNGSGKTTSVGKLAKHFKDQGKTVVLAACDTFRPAAGEQLETWAQREGVKIVRGREGQDPASVAFTAAAQLEGPSVLLVDTAGRLQTKQNLMDELSKIKRVVEKKIEVKESLLVLDATIGQNSISQAKVFSRALPLTGIILTKLDGSCKGGVVLAVENEFKVPVKMIGVGEGEADLKPFDAEEFAKGLAQ